MILVVSALTQSQQCTDALRQSLNEPFKLCSTLEEAVAELQAQQFSAVIFDELLLAAAPDEGQTAFKHLGNAVPVYVNFAISNGSRVARELHLALERRKRESLAAKREAEQLLRHEWKDRVTALLLSCEMALRVPELPEPACSMMRAVETLAREMRGKPEALGS